MVKPTTDPGRYRPAAGVVLFNDSGRVWLGRRAGEQSDFVWQMPQGGMDPGEDAQSAAIRELTEETGIDPSLVDILGACTRELYYDFPPEYRTHKRTRHWQGQRQSWFAMRFLGEDSDINIMAQTPPEFSDWRWGQLDQTPDLIVPFKRNVYEQLAIEFAPYARLTK